MSATASSSLRSAVESGSVDAMQFDTLLNLRPLSPAASSDPQLAALVLSPEQKAAIDRLALETDEPAEVCVRVWVRVSDARERRHLETAAGLALGSLDGRLADAAKLSLLDDRSAVLLVLLRLMRSRASAGGPRLSEEGVRLSNRLLREGVAGNCLAEMKRHIAVLDAAISARASGAAHGFRRQCAERCLDLLASILLFVFYSTQISASEEKELLSTVRLLSSVIVDGPPEITATRASMVRPLVLLQLAHVAACNQTAVLLTRDADDPPFFSPPSRPAGNDLPQAAGDKGGLEEDWTCVGAKGFTALTLAVLRQPCVETGECPRSDVIWFLQTASRLRAYSYVRLAMLPVLQTCFASDPALLSFASALLCELIENIVHIFSMPMYSRGRTTDSSRQPDLPFFALSQAQHVRDKTSQLRASLPSEGRVHLLGNEVRLADCLDDVLLLLAALCCARPALAAVLYSGTAHHPFLASALTLVPAEPALMRPALCLIAGSGLGNAEAAHALLTSLLPGRLDWTLLLAILNQYANQLGGRTTEIGREDVVRPRRQLSPQDVAVLLAVLEVIASCIRSPSVAQTLLTSLDLLNVLFAVLSAAVPAVLKGAVLHCLASLVWGSPACADSVWGKMELHRLVPSRILLAAGDEGAGLRHELEATEARSGQFFISDGLLALLTALVEAAGIPTCLGAGYRFPGIMPYMDHAVSGILLRARARAYSPAGAEGDAQRMRISTLAVRFLVAVLRTYDVSLASDDFSLGGDSVVVAGVSWPRPKSEGFWLMATMLDRGRSRLMDTLLGLLGEMQPQQMEACREEEASSVCATAVELMVAGRGSLAGDLDLTSMGSGWTDGDGAHWREECLGGVLGLLIEVSAREKAFLSRLAASPPMKLFCPESASPEAVPLLLNPLCRVIAWASASSSPVSLIAGAMGVQPSTSRSPSIPVMAVTLLEHLASQQTQQEDIFAAVTSLQSLSGRCVSALLTAPADVTALPPLRARGLDCFAPSAPPPAVLADPVIGPLSLSTATLLFLLGSLTPAASSRICVAHYLLGLDAVTAAANVSSAPTASASAIQLPSPVPGAPQSCLEAVIELCRSSTADPPTLCLCLELVYRLIVDSRTSSAVLGLLRRRSVNLLPYMVSKISTMLLQGTDRQSDIPVSLIHSFAWLLKICAAELHVSHSQPHSPKDSTLLNTLLFSPPGMIAVVTKVLSACQPLQVIVDSSAVGVLLSRASVEVSVSASVRRGVPSPWGQLNDPPLLATHIDSKRLDGNDPMVLSQADAMNRYSADMAAAAHCTQALKQILLVFASNEVTARPTEGVRTLTDLLLPLLTCFLANLYIEMIVLEEMAQSLLGLLGAIVELADEAAGGVDDVDVATVLGGLLRALLRRTPATCLYRGLLIGCIAQLLVLGARYPELYNISAQEMLENSMSELAELLCVQALQPGVPALRSSAAACFSLLLDALQRAAGDGATVSGPLIQCLAAVRSRGLVARLAPLLSQPSDRSTVLSLFTQLAIAEGGVPLLLDAGIVDAVMALDFTETGVLHHRDIADLLLRAAELMRTILCIHDRTADVLNGVSQFIIKNRHIVQTALRLGVESCLCLELCEVITGLLVVLVGDRVGIGALGNTVDSLAAEVTALLEYIGSSHNLGLSSDTLLPSDAWWSSIMPQTALEVQLHSARARNGLSLFERRLIQAGSRILRNCASFLRVLCSSYIDSYSKNNSVTLGPLLSIEISVVSEVFIKCSRMMKSTPSISHNVSDWMCSQHSLVEYQTSGSDDQPPPEITSVAESLICVIHDLLESCIPEETFRWSNQLSAVIASSQEDHHMPHSFVRSTGARMGIILVNAR